MKKRCCCICMISILYGSLGAATGIAQGLFRGAFETLPVRNWLGPHRWSPGFLVSQGDFAMLLLRLQVPARAHGAVNASKHSATEIAADCVGKQPASAGQPVLLLPLVVVGHARSCPYVALQHCRCFARLFHLLRCNTVFGCSEWVRQAC